MKTPPERIARRWLVERELGREPGRVTLVARARGGQPVVLHLLPGDVLADPTLARRLRRDTRQLRRLRHPHLVRPEAAGTHQGQPFVARPYFPAATLADQIALGPLSLAEAAGYTSALAGALDAAHTRGLAHGSIRAGNVLFTPAGSPLLADFLLRWLSAPGALPAPNAERDLAALAHLAYEMLAGERLPPGAMAGAALRGLRPDLPPAVPAALGRALAGGPARYTDARSLAAELEAAAEALTRAATPGGRRPRRAAGGPADTLETLPDWEDADEADEELPDEARRRRRRLAWGVVAAVLGTLAILISLAGRSATLRRTPTPTPQPAAMESASTGSETLT